MDRHIRLLLLAGLAAFAVAQQPYVPSSCVTNLGTLSAPVSSFIVDATTSLCLTAAHAGSSTTESDTFTGDILAHGVLTWNTCVLYNQLQWFTTQSVTFGFSSYETIASVAYPSSYVAVDSFLTTGTAACTGSTVSVVYTPNTVEFNGGHLFNNIGNYLTSSVCTRTAGASRIGRSSPNVGAIAVVGAATGSSILFCPATQPSPPSPPPPSPPAI